MNLRLVGEGATGTVWAAWDPTRECPVALKIARDSLARLPRFRARFAREIALTAAVPHPRIVPVLDRGTLAGGQPFAALAFAAHGSLGDLLRRGARLSVALRVMDHVLEALGALHARGLLHQDLKPENVLLHGNPAVPDAWVADLGVAGALSELAMDRRGIAGTPDWMAPEQLRGRAQELGPWTDLYAVGLLLAEILGVRRAGGPRGPAAAAHALPAALRELVDVLLCVEPRGRFDRAADARRALAAAAEGLDPTLSTDPLGDASLLGRTTTHPEWWVEAPVGYGGASAAGVPVWHRVPPGPISREPTPSPRSEPALRPAPSLFALRDPPLVGRDTERQRLWRRARYVVAAGEPQVVLVVGPAGSGKSRLVEGTARALDEGGHMEPVVLRYSDPAEPDDGYRGAVLELLSAWSDTRTEAEARLAGWLARDRQVEVPAVSAEAAVLARWCGYARADEPPANAAVGLAWLYRHLDARGWRGGACLVLEDAHNARAEGDGLAIAAALLERSVGTRPVLLVATLSVEALAQDASLAARVAELEARGAVRMDLPPLDAATLGAGLVDGLGLEAALARQVAEASGGSVTWLTTLLRDWAARDLLVPLGGGRCALVPNVSLEDELEPDLDRLIERRVFAAISTTDDPAAAEEALVVTALAGTEPPVGVVRAVADEGLEALLATGLVRQRGHRLVFEHSGVRRAALARAGGTATPLHRRLGAAWEALGRQTGADVDLPLGRHLLDGAQADRALVPLLRAARRLLVQGRAGLAFDASRLGLLAAEQADVASARVEAWQLVAESLLELERPADAQAAVDAALALDRLDRLSRARLWVVGARVAVQRGAADDARRQLDRARQVFDATSDTPGLMEIAHGEAVLDRIEGRPAAAADHYGRMLSLAAPTDLRALVTALVGRVETRLAAGVAAGVEADVARLREIAARSGDTRLIAQATWAAGLVHLGRRRLELAERFFSTARALAATLGADRLQVACDHNLGEVARFRGDVGAASLAYARAAERSESRGWGQLSGVARLHLALLALRRGDAPLVARETAGAAAQLPAAHWAWGPLQLLRALALAEAGDQAACGQAFVAARAAGVGESPNPDLWLPLERLSATCARAGWRDLAREATQLADACGGRPGTEVGIDVEDDEAPSV